MKYLLFALLLIFPLGELVHGYYINDIFVAGIVGVWLVKGGYKKITTDNLFKPLLFWSLAMAISILLNPMSTGFLYAVRFLLYAGLYFVAKDQIAEKKTILKLLEIAALVVAGFGLLQFIFLPDVSFLKAFDWDDHYYRLISTFLDPGFTGAILVLGLILSAVEGSRLKSIFLYLAMALTYSRATYLMYLTSFTTLAWFKKSTKLIIIAVLVLGITIPLLPKSTGEGTKLNRENSVTARLNNWNTSIKIWETRPIFGIGFNNYRYELKLPPESHSGGADSSLLLVLATTGIVGFAAFIYLLKTTWDMGDLLFKASLAGILVHSMFNNTLFYPFVMEWLWILLALGASAHISKQNQP